MNRPVAETVAGADSLDEGGELREAGLEQAFGRLVEEGALRLHRDLAALAATATVAGLEVATGVLALLAVVHATHSELLGGLAFSIGFLALLLGHSELFTEGFLVPVTAVVAGRARVWHLGRLWLVTLVGNLAGGWVMTWLLMESFPDLHGQAIESARRFALAPLNLQTICLSIVAGSSITLMTRMQNGTDEISGKMVAAISGAFLVAGLGMFHSVLDSLLIFAGIHSGAPDYGYLDWVRWFGYTLLGNVVGGVGLVTLLRLIRTKDRLIVERQRQQESREASSDGRRDKVRARS